MLILTAAQMLRVRVKCTEGHLIRPRLLVDGNYAVSELVLTDPAHAQVRGVLEAGSITSSYAAFASTPVGEHAYIDGKLVELHAADEDWALQPTSSGHRFELRDGDVGNPGDDPADQQRAEMVARFNQFAAGAELWQSFCVEINGAEGFQSVQSRNWGLIAQWHSLDTVTARSPVLGFDYGNNALRVVTRSDAEYSNGFAVEKVRFSGALPVGPVNFVCRFVLGQAGEIQVWRDGVEIVNLSCPIGYYNDSGNLAYLQWGIYRHASNLRSAVTTSNMRWGLTDLSDKILNPDAVG